MMKTTTSVYLILFQIYCVHSINPFNLKQESISRNLFDLTNQSIGLRILKIYMVLKFNKLFFIMI
jgi:hypothetical protein